MQTRVLDLLPSGKNMYAVHFGISDFSVRGPKKVLMTKCNFPTSAPPTPPCPPPPLPSLAVFPDLHAQLHNFLTHPHSPNPAFFNRIPRPQLHAQLQPTCCRTGRRARDDLLGPTWSARGPTKSDGRCRPPCPHTPAPRAWGSGFETFPAGPGSPRWTSATIWTRRQKEQN